ncbi:16178_t:CDS:2 [Entrophospora sp. SA101]|nr:557_t:CDS:2 [Entrophospora sp. SA101]CAJ0637286.1 16178_t:CDS:2 [Entrophospora sp. SA101]CAJ0825041.1 7180_t:CDS:2 [Entrophospora sp. SA101]CAJ0831165.1 13495_t:CDS:2 [Entrophospora sp. SA101]CAJ0840313.1 1443_t:CDS:2 [Entrophospora sp. SA101]
MEESSNHQRETKDINERITLNVGGIKYVTYISTLTQYPNTLLGTMFQERNKSLLKPTDNDNEYFFDRNGRAFHYIMEYYRTGKYLWDPFDHSRKADNFNISRMEVENELDYFQIPFPNQRLREIGLKHRKFIDDIINVLEEPIYKSLENLETSISFEFSKDNKICISDLETGVNINNCYKGLRILSDNIEKELEKKFPGIKFMNYNYNNYRQLRITLNYDFVN